MGADAIMAVEIASKYVTACGRGCDSVRIKDVVISIPGIENKQKLTQFSAVRGY